MQCNQVTPVKCHNMYTYTLQKIITVFDLKKAHVQYDYHKPASLAHLIVQRYVQEVFTFSRQIIILVLIARA